ncbi:hypothetical protein [Terasakiella pusilla]|uniref:hypothetical protein n=1 Tax=Terasakiella pusilla TaxID=64973 RepID=UPI003AA819D4
MRVVIYLSLYLLSALPVWADGPAPKVDADQITVSGVSSGAFMAQQLHLAYSDIFSGMGSVAGGPFFCAQNMAPDQIDTIKQQCMLGLGADLTAATYIAKAKALSVEGKIAPLENLKDDRVFIFNSQNDHVINPLLGNASRLFYNTFMETDAIKAWSYIPSYGPLYPVAHGMPTTKSRYDRYQNFSDRATPCAPSNAQQYPWFPNPLVRGNDPWIYHCNFGFLPGYDLGKDILWHLYGEVKTTKTFKDANLYKFDQLPFVENVTTPQELNDHGIGTTGYAYVPDGCTDGTKSCKTHVALHGCQQFPEWQFTGKVGSAKAGEKVTFGESFYKYVYNDLAESNDIIMIYPQAHNIGTEESDPNPYGCWAFWAFSEDERETYYTRDGREMKMIAEMVRALKSQRLHLSPIPTN